MEKYQTEKALLLTGLKVAKTRVSITTDTWTSLQNINYMVVTCHFLDNDWKMCKRIINVCPITSHKGEDLGRSVDSCLRQWQLTDIFTITVDNASSNDVAIQHMKRRLRSYTTLMFDGEYLHLRCACHIINLIVKDGLKELESGIAAITNCVKYIRSSVVRLDKFREYAVQEHFKGNANIPLDVVTRWNSTYHMLEVAIKFETVFTRMGDNDAACRAYFADKGGLPEADDWKSAAAFCIFLKTFSDATNKLSAWKSVTANILFVELISLQCEIDKACSSNDEILRRVGRCMKDKFDKYWGSIERMINKLIMIANVLDPRYKLEYAYNGMQMVNARPEVIDSIERDLTNLLMDMYQTYKGQNESSMDHNAAAQFMDTEEMTGLDEVSKMIARKRVASQSVVIRNEVDQYLNDRCVSIGLVNFDVANWWRINEGQYHVLTKLAKGILSSPCSTVASENAFNLGSRVVDPFRASLTPAMVEALVCTADWLRADPVNLYKEPTEDELEFYKELKDMEKEIAGQVPVEEPRAGGSSSSARTASASSQRAPEQ